MEVSCNGQDVGLALCSGGTEWMSAVMVRMSGWHCARAVLNGCQLHWLGSRAWLTAVYWTELISMHFLTSLIQREITKFLFDISLCINGCCAKIDCVINSN